MDMKASKPDAPHIDVEVPCSEESTTAGSSRSAEELLHELQVYQIELELQNEELRNSHVALEESRDRYVDFYDFAPVGYVTLNHEGMIDEINFTGTALLGVERGKLVNCRFATFIAPEDADRWYRYFITVLQHDSKQTCEISIVRSDGSHLAVQLDSLRLVKDGKVPSVRMVLTDITERKQFESELSARERRHRAVVETTSQGFWMADMDGRLLEVNDALTKLSGYSREELLEMYARDLDVKERKEETKAHIAKVKKVGWDRFETLHQRKDGSIFPVEIVVTYWPEISGFLFVFVIDITDRKLAEEKIAEYVKQLETSMQGTLQAVSNMVEFRDPYTSGHERRVGIIAADIAREMGWPEDKCKNLELIGLVHDIGKIAIPSEILTKPTRLTPLEYEMVKGHAEKGYEILKDVKFSLPIAEIIRQHHERMDGSGYPLGLHGQNILPEARIIAVADVVESMASHRPYRPSLGAEVAIKEIENHRGTLYCPTAVDALLRLIHDKGYQLPS